MYGLLSAARKGKKNRATRNGGAVAERNPLSQFKYIWDSSWSFPRGVEALRAYGTDRLNAVGGMTFS